MAEDGTQKRKLIRVSSAMDEFELVRLKKLAKNRGVSQSAVIRNLINKAYEEEIVKP